MSDALITELSSRIQRLEAVEAIRRLRSSYFSALDDRDLDAVAAVFTVDAEIGMGDWGTFPSPALFLERFAAESGGPHLYDMHHGANHVIDILGDDEATGRCDAYYAEVDSLANATFTEAYAYQDEYRRVNGTWLISRTTIRSVATIAMATREDGAVVFEQTQPE